MHLAASSNDIMTCRASFISVFCRTKKACAAGHNSIHDDVIAQPITRLSTWLHRISQFLNDSFIRISYDLNFVSRNAIKSSIQWHDELEGTGAEVYLFSPTLISVVYQLNRKRFPWISCLRRSSGHMWTLKIHLQVTHDNFQLHCAAFINYKPT